jgi:hypothetical protein
MVLEPQSIAAEVWCERQVTGSHSERFASRAIGEFLGHLTGNALAEFVEEQRYSEEVPYQM